MFLLYYSVVIFESPETSPYKKLHMDKTTRKKKKEFYGANMGHQQDHWDPTECSDECKTTAKLPG